MTAINIILAMSFGLILPKVAIDRLRLMRSHIEAAAGREES